VTASSPAGADAERGSVAVLACGLIAVAIVLAIAVVTVGGAVSIVHVYVAGSLVLPAGSTAFTANVCSPSARGPTESGLVQGA